MKLIVGIGNVGSEYENTRHNIGFMVVDAIAEHYNQKIDKEKFNSFYTILNIKQEKVILMKPTTYVNLSGNAISSIMNYYNLDIDDILVIVDDLALSLGKIRVRFKGSSGGHNGLESIFKHLKTKDVKRIRIGIDNNPLIERKNYVLSRFSKSDLVNLEKTFDRLKHLPEDFINLSFSDLMNKYNQEI